jgi:hypothetical protein
MRKASKGLRAFILIASLILTYPIAMLDGKGKDWRWMINHFLEGGDV